MRRYRFGGEELVRAAGAALIVLAAIGMFQSIYRFFSLVAASGVASQAEGEAISRVQIAGLIVQIIACLGTLGGGVYGVACAADWDRAGRLCRMGQILLGLQAVLTFFSLITLPRTAGNIFECLVGIVLAAAYWYGAEKIRY